MSIKSYPWIDEEGRRRTEPLDLKDKKARVFVSPKLSDCNFEAERLIVPAFADTHVHFREPGFAYKEGVLNGSLAAISGGVASVFDMPNCLPTTSSVVELKNKIEIFKNNCKTDWRLFLTPPSQQAAYEKFLPSDYSDYHAQIAGLKLFMSASGKCRVLSDASMLADLMLKWELIAIHAEDERFFKSLPSLPHTEKRPQKALVAALDLIEEAFKIVEQKTQKKPECRIVLLHLSTKYELDWVRQMKQRGYDLWSETCPHYIFFCAEQVVDSKLQVNPPIRTKTDQEAIKEALADGTIDILSSDHAPHTPEEKDLLDPPSGIPSIEKIWQLLALCVEKKIISWKRAIELAAINPALCYKIDKIGAIKPNLFPHLTVLYKNEAAIEKNLAVSKKIITKAAYNAYEHLFFPWEVESVIFMK